MNGLAAGSIALVAIAALSAQVTSQVADLFIDAAPPPGAAVGGPIPGVARQRWVSINQGLLRATLPATLGGTDTAQRLPITLFPGLAITAVLVRTEKTAAGYVWIGRIDGIEMSSVTLAVSDEAMAGAIATPQGRYTIRQVSGGLHVVQETDPSTRPPRGEPIRVPGLPADPPGGGGPRTQDDGSIIDVLVVYTPAVRSRHGSTSGVLSAINVDVTETNEAYQNSGVVQRIRLVGAEEIAYTESGSSNTDLDRLQATSDGHMDSVHARRDALGADIVHLIAVAPDVCGLAFLMTSVGASFASFAFGLTHVECMGDLTVPHELGHNMGLTHDTYVSPGDGAFAYAHGYVNQAAFAPGASPSKRWRDLMSYRDQCADAGFTCSELTYFSSPDNTFLGDPMGTTSTADGVRALNNTAVTVANFRQASLPLLSINDVSVTEGNSGTTTATFTVSLSAATGSTVSVNYTTGHNTATDSDYVTASGSLSFSPGSTSRTLIVSVVGDPVFEPNESFEVNLSNASNASIADFRGIGTILNDDHPAFTDATLSAGSSVIKAVHITELRDRINAIRATHGLMPASWTRSTLTAQSTSVLAVDISELRTALGQAYAAANQTPPSYEDPGLGPGSSIKAVHITQLRAAVLGIE
jgi:hypothetical protein